MQSRAALTAAVTHEAQRLGIPYEGPGSPEPDDITVEVPRPPHWGGYRLNVDAVELWVEGEFRIHDRARWTRPLEAPLSAAIAAPWTATRLQP